MSDFTPQVIADTVTNTSAGTYSYPDDDGVDLSGYSSFGLFVTAEDCTVTVEGSMDRATWVDVSGFVFDLTWMWPIWGGYTFGASEDKAWVGVLSHYPYVRLRVTYPDGTNALHAQLARGTA